MTLDNNDTRIAAVIGCTGSFGGAVTRELLRRGWNVRALARNVAKARAQYVGEPRIEFVRGDALDAEDVRILVEGVDVLVDSFNVPYQHWDPATLDSASIVAQAAIDHDLLVAFPGNVYGLGPDFSRPLDESAPHVPPSKKGKLRNRIEATFEEASQHGARFVIVRCGDFFGPNMPAESSWLWYMTEKALDGGPIVYPGDLQTPHQWAYLPDVGRVTVDLIERADQFQPFEVFHFGGHMLEPCVLVDAVRRALGDTERKLKKFPWWAVNLGRPFSAMMRELHEMRYLWDEPLQMDDAKLRRALGEVPHTPLDAAVRATIAGLQDRRGAAPQAPSRATPTASPR